MFSYECVLAAVLINAPADNPWKSDEIQAWFVPLRQYLVGLALEGEILDDREVQFFLVQPQNFCGDLKVLQVRSRELAQAPYLEECQRFPHRHVVSEFLTFNRAYRQDLAAQLSLDLVHADELRSAMLETDWLHHIWDTLRDARCEYYYITVRRHALQTLRDLIGPEAFYRGQMPPHVPSWRFAELN